MLIRPLRSTASAVALLALILAVVPACTTALGKPAPRVTTGAPSTEPQITPMTDISAGCAGSSSEVEEASAPPGYVYAEWISCGGIGFARSADSGRHFGAALTVPGSPGFSWDPAITVAADGTVYAAFMHSTGQGASAVSGRPSIGGVDASGVPNLTSAGVPMINTIGTLTGAAASSQPFGVMLASLVNKGSSIDALVTALESKGLVRRLAEPDLIALSGDTASFLAGGEFPVPVAQTTSGSAPTITVQYKPFGVQLTFSPTVLGNGLINLRLAPSVSEIDTTNSVQVSGFSIPALTTREARTTVELRDGQSFAIAGLLQSTNTEDISQLPWVGSVPVLGTLFRSTSYQKHETDLVIIVTPHLVKPAAPGDHLATPFDQRLPGNDVDIFAMGQLERKKKYTEYVSSGGGLEGPYGHILDFDQDANSYVTRK